MIEKKFKITNENGLHARPATEIVKEAVKYNCSISLTVSKTTVDLKSIMGVMSLGAYKGEIIKIICNGEDEDEAMKMLTFIVNELKLGKEI